MRIEPISGFLTAILLLLAAAANGASLESLVMPGPVAEAHAETEETCSACHDLFERGAQRMLCLDCHEKVASDLDTGTGFHGRQPDAETVECSSCHAEHNGRDADLLGLQPSHFDHEMTDFALTGAHSNESCGGCHEAGAPHRDAPTECAGCHETDDPHSGNLGQACGDCHEPVGWQSATFDHDSTDFPLLGGHQDAACLGCHTDQHFEPPAGECVDCHQIDDVHNGTNGDDCGDCHSSTAWTDSLFDHGERTGFELEDAHAILSCGNCHVGEGEYEELPTSCVGCHASDDVHLGRNGEDCASCHDQSNWSRSFDHLAETGYALLGTHAEQACTACHTEGFEQPVAIDCAGCHQADDPHDGTLIECDDCHGQNAWDTEQVFQHDLVSFALVGLHRVASCEQCHDSLVFSPLSNDCADCHADEDHHEGAMGNECGTCHSPAGWAFSSFDHDAMTDFPLTGAHTGIACSDCHQPGQPADRQSRACAACHRSDDIHAGRFGQNCDRCHLTTSFEELKDDF
jgi:hypothetical protein